MLESLKGRTIKSYIIRTVQPETMSRNSYGLVLAKIVRVFIFQNDCSELVFTCSYADVEEAAAKTETDWELLLCVMFIADMPITTLGTCENGWANA